MTQLKERTKMDARDALGAAAEIHSLPEIKRRLRSIAKFGGPKYVPGGHRFMQQVQAAVSIVEHPLLPPTVLGTDITVDAMLNQPTRVTRLIADLTLQRFIASYLYSSPGGVSGGAVLYDQAVLNELYTTRDVQRVQPGEEFPLVTSDRQVPKVAEVSKWGGKFWIPDEAKDRNDVTLFMNRSRQLANTVVRKVNARSVATVEAEITAFGQTFTGVSWSTVVTGGSSQSNNSLWPLRDFIKAKQLSETAELGVDINLALLNPIDYANLLIVYGAQNLPVVLEAIGYNIFVSNRVVAGSAYFAEEGAVGEMRLEKPLTTETWREQGRQRNWVQTDVRPVEFVTNPYAIYKGTGIA